MTMRALPVIAALTLVPPTRAQDGAQAQIPHESLLARPCWELSGSVLYSDPPGSEERVIPIVYADRGALHLEARYNYEDLETLALFAGWTLETEEDQGTLAAAATPMLGAAFGETWGIAPAVELELGWKRLAWYAEMEYLFDLDDRDDDFFYSWSTLTYGFTDWLAAGLVAERSRVVETDRWLQRGLALELGAGRLGISLYAFDLDTDEAYAVLALELAP